MSTPACPHHRVPMRELRPGPGLIEYLCERCNGLWLPGELVHARIGITKPAQAARQAAPTRLRCPDDDQPLLAVIHHGIEIDICPCCHGVWLDTGEYERIVAGAGMQGASQKNRPNALDVADAGVQISAGIAEDKLLEGLLENLLDFIGNALSGL